jgi:hypothetical protein
MSDDPQTTFLGKLVLLLFVGACLAGGLWWMRQGDRSDATAPGSDAPAHNTVADTPRGDAVRLVVAYGTEKRSWLTWAASAFAETAAGRNIAIELRPLGSLQGAQAIVRSEPIHLWAPASSLAKETLLSEWGVRHGGNPIAREESLALTPMALVWWRERQATFPGATAARPGLRDIAQAVARPDGWNGLAGRPDWGLFKFGHTDPASSNSGLTALLTMAYAYHDRDRGLTVAHIVDAGFQTWLSGLAAGAVGTRTESTGTMMRDMVLKGPSSYDCLLVYESVAIEHLAHAEGRWGSLQIDYPEHNFWNDNPAYILDVPWSSPAQRQAATAFVRFLLSEAAQRRALTFGFRPADPAVPVLGGDSPFERFRSHGLRNDIGTVAETPAPTVVSNLLQSWQRARLR